MSDRTNLIYNADLSEGTDGWVGTVSGSGGVITATGNIRNGRFIPVSSNRRYRISLDFKVTENDGSSSFYLAFYPYDSSKRFIDNYLVNKLSTTADTTLAVDLKSGDTTATLTDASNWTFVHAHRRIGICNVLAWGTNRASASYRYDTVNDNVVTLLSAYTGTTIPAGTAVGPFYSSSAYYYPKSWTNAGLPSDWQHVSVEFSGGNSIRYSCQYVCFATLGYQHTYQIKDLRFECISDVQLRTNFSPSDRAQVTGSGLLLSSGYKNVGAPIRYIRNSVSGNSVNANGHLNEIKAINDVGENIAWHKKVNGLLTYPTDGTVDANYMRIAGSPATFTLDLGFIENIQKIQIWHYYSDGRTYYDDTVEVSQDGQNWVTVYKGEKPETINGNEIILSPHVASILSTGEVYGHDFYEY